jgi:hypothetical protein
MDYRDESNVATAGIVIRFFVGATRY